LQAALQFPIAQIAGFFREARPFARLIGAAMLSLFWEGPNPSDEKQDFLNARRCLFKLPRKR
jgi:hypothetical protein